MNKGISPLIATVLLIGFTIVLAAVVIRWGGNFITEKTEETGKESEIAIKSLGVDLEINLVRQYGNEVDITLKNTGKESIKDFLIRVNGASGSENFDNNGELMAFTTKTFNVKTSNIGDLESVEVFPKIEFDGSLVNSDVSFDINKDSDKFCEKPRLYIVDRYYRDGDILTIDYLSQILEDEGFEVNKVSTVPTDISAFNDYDIVISFGYKGKPEQENNRFVDSINTAYSSGKMILTEGNSFDSGLNKFYIIDGYSSEITDNPAISWRLNKDNCLNEVMCTGWDSIDEIADNKRHYITNNKGIAVGKLDANGVGHPVADNSPGMIYLEETGNRWVHIQSALNDAGEDGQETKNLIIGSVKWLVQGVC